MALYPLIYTSVEVEYALFILLLCEEKHLPNVVVATANADNFPVPLACNKL